MDKDYIKQVYSGKILGVRNYKSDKREIRVNDFLDLEELEYFLGEVSTGESDITPAGKSFIEQYYGFNDLAKTLVDKGIYGELEYECDNGQNTDKLASWLYSIHPMEVTRFIQEAHGNIQPGAELKDEFLPPSDLIK